MMASIKVGEHLECVTALFKKYFGGIKEPLMKGSYMVGVKSLQCFK